MLPSLPPSVEKPWLKAAAIFADMFALFELVAIAAAACPLVEPSAAAVTAVCPLVEAASGKFEDMLEERCAPSKISSPTSTTHGPCTISYIKVGQVSDNISFFVENFRIFHGLSFGDWSAETFVKTHPS